MTTTTRDNSEVKFAMMDRASSLMSIFKHIPRQRIKEDRPKFFAKKEFDGKTIEIKAFDMLDIIDQSVLLAIIALAPIKDDNNKSLVINGRKEDSDQSDIALELLRKMGVNRQEIINLDESYSKFAVIKCSIYTLSSVAGMGKSKESIELVKNSLERLANCTYKFDNNGKEGTTQHFISYSYKDTVNYTISLNSIFTRAFTHQYTRIQLNERKELNSRNYLAQLIHSHLCAIAIHGKETKIKAKTIEEKFLHDFYKPKSAAKVRQSIKNAMDKINELSNWYIVSYGKADNLTFKISRI